MSLTVMPHRGGRSRSGWQRVVSPQLVGHSGSPNGYAGDTLGYGRMGVTVKLRDGDVFSIPLGDGRAGLGQIVGHYGKSAYFFAIFDSVVPEQEIPIKFQDVLAGPVKLLALSMDAKLHVGDWRVVAQAPVRADIPLPAYKEAVTTHDHIDVVDHSGTRRRRATKAEATSLPNRSIVAPVRLERALKASLGLEQWLEAYEELRPHGITSREAFS